MAYKDYEMKVCELEEALRLSDIRKDILEKEVEKLRLANAMLIKAQNLLRGVDE